MATAKADDESSNSTKKPEMSTDDRLCSVVDTTFDKIRELQELLSQESELLGADVKNETLDPILKKQRSLLSRISSLQKSRGILKKGSSVGGALLHSSNLSSGETRGHNNGMEPGRLPPETSSNPLMKGLPKRR